MSGLCSDRGDLKILRRESRTFASPLVTPLARFRTYGHPAPSTACAHVRRATDGRAHRRAVGGPHFYVRRVARRRRETRAPLIIGVSVSVAFPSQSQEPRTYVGRCTAQRATVAVGLSAARRGAARERIRGRERRDESSVSAERQRVVGVKWKRAFGYEILF